MLEWKMITQLLNKAVWEGQEHTAANDEIWSFGFNGFWSMCSYCRMCDLMRSRCCNCVLFTQPEVNKKINASRAVWRWTKRVLFLVLLSDFIGESEGWWPSSSAALHFIWSQTSTWARHQSGGEQNGEGRECVGDGPGIWHVICW